MRDLLLSLSAGLTLAAAPASAQLMLPGAQFPGSDAPTPGVAAPPPQARAVAVRIAGEGDILGKVLKRNGLAGGLKVERAGGGYAARVTLEGTMVSRPGEACAVQLNGGEAVALQPGGRPNGTLRYVLQAPVCPLAFDVLDDAVLVVEPAEACIIEAADCRVPAEGLWGVEPAALLPQAKAIETARGAADKAVRDNFRALTQRARPQDMRTVVSEQAAFSSQREETCRTYAREGAHGFCHARFTEARAASLAARLGVAPAPASGQTQAQPPRRAAPRPPAPQALQ